MRLQSVLAGFLLAGATYGPASHGEPYDRNRDQTYDQTDYGVVTLEERVSKLEKQLSPLLETAKNTDQLQAEVLSLRGQLEEMSHQLETVKKQQTDMYMELDQRLQQSGTAPQQPLDASAPTPSTNTEAPSKAPSSSGGDSVGRQAAYQKAFNTLKDGKYADAIKEFKAFTATYPNGEYADNAQYWLGEAYYVNRDLSTARDTFRKMLKDFPQSGKAADALLKIGYIEYDNGQYANAKELLADVMKRYPDSSAAKLAEKRLEKMRQEKH